MIFKCSCNFILFFDVIFQGEKTDSIQGVRIIMVLAFLILILEARRNSIMLSKF